MLAIEEILRELSGEDVNEQGLPPGFRFHPTDEELITFYLASKVFNGSFSGVDIAEVDLNRCEPWELPDIAKMGEREWYFFSLRDRKYPTGLRTNRATGAGYWKATGKDREVFSASSGALLGMKKTLVFYKGRAPRGEKTKWVMHEYRLDGDFSCRHTCKEEWVICRIHHKTGDKKSPLFQGRQSSYLLEALPALMETTTNPPTRTTPNTNTSSTSSSSSTKNTSNSVLEYQTQSHQMQGLHNPPLFLNNLQQDNDHLKSLHLIMNNNNNNNNALFPISGCLIPPSFSPTATATATATVTATTSSCTTTTSSATNNNTSPSAFQSMLFKSLLLSHQDCTSKEQQQQPTTVPKQCKTEVNFSHFQPILPNLPLPNPFHYHPPSQIQNQNQNQNPPPPPLFFDHHHQMDDHNDHYLGFSSAAAAAAANAQLHDMSTSLAFNRPSFQTMLDPSLTKLPGGESWPLDA